MEIIRIAQAEEIPEQWDHIAESPFQKRAFMLHCEKYNPCRQRYYLLFNDGILKACAIVYSLALNLLTFARLKSTVSVTIIGVPASVSSAGIFGNRQDVETLKSHICSREKGFILFLNLTEKPQKGIRAQGNTLPTIIMENPFDEWDKYIQALRAPYRRRILQITEQGKNLKLKRIPCHEFTNEMYRLYLQVFNRSNDKLEKLSIDFFSNLPESFLLTTCCLDGRLLGWNISIFQNDIFYFFMGGVDYEWNVTHNTYFHLLARLLKDGIEHNAKFIDLGQTAEIPKMRLGGEVRIRYMEAQHSNGFINAMLKASSPLLAYRKTLKKANVFKEPSPRMNPNTTGRSLHKVS